MKSVDRKAGRTRRHARIRKEVHGTAARLRLCVMVSNQHIYAQLVDDERSATVATVSSAGKGGVGGKNVSGAKLIGQRIGELAKQMGVETVVFDRGGYRYHGRVKAVADAVREAGIKF